MSGGPDPLFAQKNNFYMGAYQAAVNESTVHGFIGLSEAATIERDSIMYRAYIALGQYQLVIDEISSAAPTALQAVKLLAQYFSGGSNKEKALSSISEWTADPVVASNPTFLLVAGTLYAHEKMYNEALKLTHVGGTLDLCALNVQIYLKMNRTDFAEKQLKIMQQIDEDHTLTQLANAWCNVCVGGSKIKEAFDIFQELCEKYTWTVPLMNGSAICHMHTGRYEDAETLLLEALSKDAKDADTLANLIVCDLHLGKPTGRYMSQLKTSHPDHPLVQRSVSAEESLERAIHERS